jgi:hypothetical protein
MNTKTLVTLAALTCFAVSAAMAQQKVAPPPQPAEDAEKAPPRKPKNKGPSLDVTMKFIQDKLNSVGTVNVVSYVHDGVAGNDWTAQFAYGISPVNANALGCLVNYHFKQVLNGQSVRDQDAGIPLKLVENIIVMPIDQSLKEVNAKEGHPSLSTRTDPPAFTLRAVRSDGASNEIFFQDQDLANRVATAMVHAVELCGGGNKDPF